MKLLLAIAAGGALGALARYKVGAFALRWYGEGFVYGTLLVNIAGSFLLGLLAGGLAVRLNLSGEARAFLMIGFCGAFTTFSTFALEVVSLGGRGDVVLAGGYAALSVAGAVLALSGGLALSRMLFA